MYVVDASLRTLREELIREHFAAEERRDFDGALATFKMPRYELVGTGETFDGPAEVMRYYERSRAAIPDQHGEIITLHHADDAVIAEFWLVGTHLGRLGKLAPTGKSVRVRMVAVFEFEGDGLVCERIYFDSSSMLRQLTTERGRASKEA